MNSLDELIAELQSVREKKGNLEVYGIDMNRLKLEVCEGGDLEDEDSPTHGKTYLCIG